MIPRFRAFECVTNTMWQSHEIGVCFRQDELYIEVPRGKNGAVYFGESLNRIILMQSTGLYDKNGVEICEGDILEGYSVYPTGCDFYSHVKGEVYYSNRGTWDCYSFLLGDLNEQLEVIGNIYESPELVEVEE